MGPVCGMRKKKSGNVCWKNERAENRMKEPDHPETFCAEEWLRPYAFKNVFEQGFRREMKKSGPRVRPDWKWA
jgi:hypothetical protein